MAEGNAVKVHFVGNMTLLNFDGLAGSLVVGKLTSRLLNGADLLEKSQFREGGRRGSFPSNLKEICSSSSGRRGVSPSNSNGKSELWIGNAAAENKGYKSSLF